MPAPAHDELPVACTLGAAERRERVAAWRALGGDSLAATSAGAEWFEARFRATGRTRARLERLVELERHCCAFLSFALAHDDESVILRIGGPAAASTGAALLGARSAGNTRGERL